MTLSQKRCIFSANIAKLILWASMRSLYLALDQVKRTQAEANQNAQNGTGISNSLHLIGLAADLNLYINGVYQTSSEAHKEIGEYWKRLHPLNRWGGDFKKKDGNHYSMEHNGVK